MATISKLPAVSAVAADDIAPIVHGGDNYSVSMDVLKEYFRDSSLAIFDTIDESTSEVIQGSAGNPEEGFTYAVVYLPYRSTFAYRRRKEGVTDAYFSQFSRVEDFMADGAVRSDRVFFNISDKGLYVYSSNLRNIFDTVRINAMTEEEFENLQNPVEGAFYATYE